MIAADVVAAALPLVVVLTSAATVHLAAAVDSATPETSAVAPPLT
jgi:hypothetical protein